MKLACGVVGAGAIGRGFAASLARAGFPVEVFDIDPEAAAATGVPVAASLEALAQNADVVLLALPDTPEIEEALAGGLEQGLRPGSAEKLHEGWEGSRAPRPATRWCAVAAYHCASGRERSRLG